LSRYFTAEIVHNLPLNSKNGLITIKPLEQVPNPKPGQFYMLAVSDSHDPILKRPFSFFRKTPEGIQFLYEARGRGTMMMKGFRGGKIINVLGPLGKGYPEPERNNMPLLIAGGIGIASIFSLIEAFSNRAHVFYGARDKAGLLMLNELQGLSDKLLISTDDGSMGKQGTVVDVLTDFLTHMSTFTQANPESVRGCGYSIYACGPKPMLKAVSQVALEKGIRGYVSAEENMACGVGACLGCAIKVKRKKSNRPLPIDNPPIPLFPHSGRLGRLAEESGFAEAKEKGGFENVGCGGITNSESIYKMVCKDGPVFPMEEIVWK
jgi:dihydroorotate dehydrogenase electron transfer subunit